MMLDYLDGQIAVRKNPDIRKMEFKRAEQVETGLVIPFGEVVKRVK